jgi:hypothetical protein
MKLRAWLVFVGFIALGWMSGVTAIPITFDFTATVTSINPALAGFFTLNETLTGSYTFESTTPGLILGSTADYPAITAFSVTGSGFSGSWTGGDIFVQDAPLDDEYSAEGRTGFSGTNAGLGVLPTAGLFLFDNTGTMLSNILLPLTPPGLPGGAEFGIDYLLGPETRVDLGATLTSLTLVPTPAPEPSTISLIGLALAAIGRSYRRRQN